MENNYKRSIKKSEGTSANQTIPLEFNYEVVACMISQFVISCPTNWDLGAKNI